MTNPINITPEQRFKHLAMIQSAEPIEPRYKPYKGWWETPLAWIVIVLIWALLFWLGGVVG